MSAHEQLAHEANALARSGEHEAAVDRACRALLLLLNEGQDEGRFSITFQPLAEMRVKSRSQLEITSRGGVHLLCARELVDDWFTNWLDAFTVIRTLFAAMGSAPLPNGSCIFDIEDGSSQGDYFRVAFGATNDNALLVVDSYWVKYRGYAALREQIAAAARPWHERADTVFWRGGTTGLRSFTPAANAPVTDWSWLQRLQLCDVASRSRFRDKLDVGVVHFAQVPEPYLVAEIERAGFMRERCDKLSFLDYRYIIDIDGNANAWDGLFGAMLMGACILKVESRAGWREWYYDMLKPFEHYVPIKSDLSDLDEKMDWIASNSNICRIIAEKAYTAAWQMEYQGELETSSRKILLEIQKG